MICFILLHYCFILHKLSFIDDERSPPHGKSDSLQTRGAKERDKASALAVSEKEAGECDS